MKFRIALLLCSLFFVACGISPDIEATSPEPTNNLNTNLATRSAPVRTSDAPLTQGTPSSYTVTVRGWAIDDVTKERIEGAQFVVVTVVGSYEFKDSFEVSFPADTVLQVLAKADGYAEKSVQIKPHYGRNVLLDMQIPLVQPTPTPGGKQG